MTLAPTLPHFVWVAAPPRGPQAALGRPGAGLSARQWRDAGSTLAPQTIRQIFSPSRGA